MENTRVLESGLLEFLLKFNISCRQQSVGVCQWGTNNLNWLVVLTTSNKVWLMLHQINQFLHERLGLVLAVEQRGVVGAALDGEVVTP